MEKESPILLIKKEFLGHNTICRNCDHPFSFKKSQVYPDRNDSFGESAPIEKFVNCPKCSHSIMVTHIISKQL